MSDSVLSSDEPYINPAFITLLGSVINLLPLEEAAISYFERARLMSPTTVVDLIASSPEYSSQFDVIHNSLYGMDLRGVGRYVSRLVDDLYPSLMEKLNTDEAAFSFYHDVIELLFNRIIGDGEVT